MKNPFTEWNQLAVELAKTNRDKFDELLVAMRSIVDAQKTIAAHERNAPGKIVDMLDPRAVTVVRAVSVCAHSGDYCGIADGEETLLGVLQHAILFTEKGEKQIRDEEIVAMFAAIANTVPTKLLEKLSRIAKHLIADQRRMHTDMACEALAGAGAA